MRRPAANKASGDGAGRCGECGRAARGPRTLAQMVADAVPVEPSDPFGLLTDPQSVQAQAAVDQARAEYEEAAAAWDTAALAVTRARLEPRDPYASPEQQARDVRAVRELADAESRARDRRDRLGERVVRLNQRLTAAQAARRAVHAQSMRPALDQDDETSR